MIFGNLYAFTMFTFYQYRKIMGRISEVKFIYLPSCFFLSYIILIMRIVSTCIKICRPPSFLNRQVKKIGLSCVSFNFYCTALERTEFHATFLIYHFNCWYAEFSAVASYFVARMNCQLVLDVQNHFGIFDAHSVILYMVFLLAYICQDLAN